MVIEMKSVEELAKIAKQLKEKGMNDKDIATEMHLSLNTVIWLLSGESKSKEIPNDVKIGWRSIGVYGSRISHIAEVMTEIIEEETFDDEKEVDTVVGITINGIPYASFISYLTGKELGIYRALPQKGEGTFSSNYASVTGKRVVLVDDVISTGETVTKAIQAVKSEKGEVALIVVLTNKTGKDEMQGVPIRSLIRARLIG